METQLYNAIICSDERTIRSLLNNGADLNMIL